MPIAMRKLSATTKLTSPQEILVPGQSVQFKAFLSALPYMWSDKVHWYRDKRDKPWDVFTPFIEAWNVQQQELFDEYSLAVMDESMVSWVPKTSRLGGLPNYTFEPRKPTPLGTMLKDTAEVTTGILLNTDPLMSPSIQDRKQFGNDRTHSPEFPGTNTPHQAHVAESLRQAYFSNLKEDNWIGGDAWFGSVACCLALKLEEVTHIDNDGTEHEHPLNVESSFIVKNNTALFPRKPLYEIIKARHKKHMAGHWVVMSTKIKGVPLIAVAYAWNNKDVTFMISTIGNTSPCQDPYVCYDPNTGWDAMDTKQYPRPDIVNFLFKHLPVIDGFNKLRQFSLAIEKQWPTKNCWVKLLTAYLGNSVVNMQCLYSYVYPGIAGKDLTPQDMAGTITKGLKIRRRRVLPSNLIQQENVLPLKRVADANGNTAEQVTEKQQNKQSKGSSRQRTCFTCKRYQAKYVWCTGACPRCVTAVCLTNNRPTSCLEEHLNSGDPHKG